MCIIVTTHSIVQRFKHIILSVQTAELHQQKLRLLIVRAETWCSAQCSSLIFRAVVITTVAVPPPLASFFRLFKQPNDLSWEPLNGNVKVWVLHGGEGSHCHHVRPLEGGRCAFAIKNVPQISAAGTTWKEVALDDLCSFFRPFFCCQDKRHPRAFEMIKHQADPINNSSFSINSETPCIIHNPQHQGEWMCVKC